MRTLLVILVLAWALPTLADADATIRVEGTGVVSAKPDRATFSLEVSRQSMSATEAQQQVEDQSSRIISGIRALPLLEDSLRAASLNVSPQYSWQPDRRSRIFEGYRVSRRISFTMTDLDLIGQTYQTLTELGATAVDPARLSASNQAALSREALARAYADAEAQASVLADAAGHSLGPATSIDASPMRSVGPPVMARAAMDVAEATVGVYEPGTLDFTRAVVVVFEVKDPD